MFKRAIALAGAAACVGTLAVATPALAADSDTKTVATGSYNASTGGFSCTSVVLNDGDGGNLSLRVRANEMRLMDKHFRSAAISTRIIAQELDYNGKWVTVKRGGWHWGTLGATHTSGSYNVASVVFDKGTHPRYSLNVKGFDDLFRLKSITKFYGDEGNRIAKLVNTEGMCRV